jgi:HPr kinase/phosphorylase
MKFITVGELLKEQRDRLKLELVSRDARLNRRIATSEVNRPGLALAGYPAHFRAERVQIIGRGEHAYIARGPAARLGANLSKILSHRSVPCVVITHSLRAPKHLQAVCQRYGVPLLRTRLKTGTFVEELTAWLEEQLSERTRLHGVLVDVHGLGVFIRGDAGIGKSESALELVKRGHIFVADDIVEIRHKPGDILVGSCPEALQHFMEVRGLGIIDVKLLFGIGAILRSSVIGLVVDLEMWNPQARYDRVGLERSTTRVLNVDVARVVIPVRPGRHIASLIEVAALNQQLKSQGLYSAEAFNERLLARMGRTR